MTCQDVRKLSKEDIELITLDVIKRLQATYQPGRNREITRDNVFHAAVLEGQKDFEEFVDVFLLPGSCVEGLEHLDDCQDRLARGETVIFLPEHRSNFDTPAFHTLLRREDPKYKKLLDVLIYVAGRKLNESSDLVNMFTEKYSRLIIVPRRDFPSPTPGEGEEDARAREQYERYASLINRAAFRKMVQLKKAGNVFVLFPLGGRLKPDADNIPVRETTSYLKTFHTAYLISMEGNPLRPRPVMEDERPSQDEVVFRVGRALESKRFLNEQRGIFDQACAAGGLVPEPDFEQFTAGRIMNMLEQLRVSGDFDTAFSP